MSTQYREPTERLLPQNLDAETGVLGSLLIDPGAILDVRDIVRPADFYREAHRQIYAAILDLYSLRQPADLITLCDELARRGVLEGIGGISYVSSLANHVPTAANAAFYAQNVADSATLRRLISAAGQIAAVAYSGTRATAALEQAHQALRAVANGMRRDTGYVTFAQAADSLQTQWLESMQRGRVLGAQFGFAALDQHTMGIMGGELAYVMGRPGAGKSAFAVDIAQYRAEQCAARHAADSSDPGGVVLYVTLEMKARSQVQRLLAARSGVDGRLLRAHFVDADGTVHVSAYQRAKAALDERRARIGAHLVFWDTRATMSSLRALCDRLADERGRLDCVVLDYVGLVADDDRRSDIYQRLTRISQELKQLASDMDVPVIALAQMNRSVEHRDDRRPQLADMRDSGGLEADANWVFGLYRGAYYDKARAQNDDRFREFAELHVLKARDGVDSALLPLRFEGALTRFTDWPRDWPWPADESRKVAEPERRENVRPFGAGAYPVENYTENHEED